MVNFGTRTHMHSCNLPKFAHFSNSERKKTLESRREREKEIAKSGDECVPHYIQSMTMTINKAYDLNFSLEFRLDRPFISRTISYRPSPPPPPPPLLLLLLSSLFSHCCCHTLSVDLSFDTCMSFSMPFFFFSRLLKNWSAQIIGIYSFLHARLHIFFSRLLLLFAAFANVIVFSDRG